jgi:hypothetical protein
MKKPTEENPYKLINQLARQNGFANYGEAMKSLADEYKKLDPTKLKFEEK